MDQTGTAAATAKLLQSCLTLCNPMDCSPPGSSTHGIFQARVLEWGAIPFSGLFGSPMQIMGWRPIWQDFDNPDQIIQASSVQFSSVAQSCLTLSDPMDRSLPGSSTHGIFQARVLEWGAIAFSVNVYE